MTGKKDALGALADATGLAVGSAKREIDALADATGRAIGALHEQIADEIGPAVAAAQARASVLVARRAEVIAILADWLQRCADDAA